MNNFKNPSFGPQNQPFPQALFEEIHALGVIGNYSWLKKFDDCITVDKNALLSLYKDNRDALLADLKTIMNSAQTPGDKPIKVDNNDFFVAGFMYAVILEQKFKLKKNFFTGMSDPSPIDAFYNNAFSFITNPLSRAQAINGATTAAEILFANEKPGKKRGVKENSGILSTVGLNPANKKITPFNTTFNVPRSFSQNTTISLSMVSVNAGAIPRIINDGYAIINAVYDSNAGTFSVPPNISGAALNSYRQYFHDKFSPNGDFMHSNPNDGVHNTVYDVILANAAGDTPEEQLTNARNFIAKMQNAEIGDARNYLADKSDLRKAWGAPQIEKRSILFARSTFAKMVEFNLRTELNTTYQWKLGKKNNLGQIQLYAGRDLDLLVTNETINQNIAGMNLLAVIIPSKHLQVDLMGGTSAQWGENQNLLISAQAGTGLKVRLNRFVGIAGSVMGVGLFPTSSKKQNNEQNLGTIEKNQYYFDYRAGINFKASKVDADIYVSRMFSLSQMSKEEKKEQDGFWNLEANLTYHPIKQIYVTGKVGKAFFADQDNPFGIDRAWTFGVGLGVRFGK
ncbi:MAG: hypothetical protein NT051_02275 [Candidatus Micrarchaeota archaeon]|nr:hypothetical protein [Candidatus Micrarchaeota archaeon]